MWFVIAALESTAASAFAADPTPSGEVDPTELEERAHARTTRGAAEVGLGLGIAAGGVFVLSFQRGDSGGISQEEQWVMDARSISGGLLIIGGLTTLVVGGNDVSVGRRLHLQAAAISPAWIPGGAGAVLSARF